VPSTKREIFSISLISLRTFIYDQRNEKHSISIIYIKRLQDHVVFQQMKVYRHRVVARFGLMHMIGTNLSVWLNVLVQETKHEILTFYNPEINSLRISHRLGKRIARRSFPRRQLTSANDFQVRKVGSISAGPLILIMVSTCGYRAVSKGPITCSSAGGRT